MPKLNKNISMNVTLDVASKQALVRIQKTSSSLFLAASVASTADIMQVFRGKPIKRIKKVFRKDWDEVSMIAKSMNDIQKGAICETAMKMTLRYPMGSELHKFWEEIVDGFSC